MLSHGFFRGWWSDAGTFESLAIVTELLRQGENK